MKYPRWVEVEGDGDPAYGSPGHVLVQDEAEHEALLNPPKPRGRPRKDASEEDAGN